jgi:Fe-S cluster assembly protein SufD
VSSLAQERDVLRAKFERFAEALSRSEAPWLRPIRTAAMARFTERGFPTTKDEDWKYTSVAEITRTPFTQPEAFTASSAALAAAGLVSLGGPQLVFVNGRLSDELSDLRWLPGLTLTSLRAALASGSKHIEPHLTRIVPCEKSAFAALNTACFEDGVVLEIAGVIADPIQLVFYSEPGSGAPTASYPRVLILAGPGSQAVVVESYLGRGRYLTDAVTEVVLQDGARLEHLKLQQESETAFHVATLGVVQGRASRFVSRHFALGAALSRTDIDTRFDGEGGECELDGLFMAAGSQLSDTHTRIDHARPRCASRELYKGVLDGRARGVFHGRIVVRKDAQKTDAHQANRNLLLSKEALVQSTPQLEILADDVKCKHGSTTGQLDEASLFYLRSRGIGEAEARGLLTYAFASDLVQRVRIEPLRAALEALIGARLPGAGELLR